MATKEIDLHELANAVLESIKAGEEYVDEYSSGFCDYVGYNVGALRRDFETVVEDMRDYSEPDHQDWVDFFGAIDKDRHRILISQPYLATVDDLRIWIGSNEQSAYQCFCGAAGIYLTSDESGPVVVIGTMGDNTEAEIFLVCNSVEEAEKTWTMDWI